MVWPTPRSQIRHKTAECFCKTCWEVPDLLAVGSRLGRELVDDLIQGSRVRSFRLPQKSPECRSPVTEPGDLWERIRRNGGPTSPKPFSGAPAKPGLQSYSLRINSRNGGSTTRTRNCITVNIIDVTSATNIDFNAVSVTLRRSTASSIATGRRTTRTINHLYES